MNLTCERYTHFPKKIIAWISKNIWIPFLRALFNWSPQLHLHPFPSLFELQQIFWQLLLLFSTHTQIGIKSETAKEKTSKYFHLKLFLLQKMGAKVVILAKSLIPNFLRACVIAIVHYGSVHYFSFQFQVKWNGQGSISKPGFIGDTWPFLVQKMTTQETLLCISCFKLSVVQHIISFD